MKYGNVSQNFNRISQVYKFTLFCWFTNDFSPTYTYIYIYIYIYTRVSYMQLYIKRENLKDLGCFLLPLHECGFKLSVVGIGFHNFFLSLGVLICFQPEVVFAALLQYSFARVSCFANPIARQCVLYSFLKKLSCL